MKIILLFLFTFFIACEGREEKPKKITTGVVCKDENVDKEALIPAGKLAEGVYILPDGKKITPAGVHLQTGIFPIAIAVKKDGKKVYITHNGDKSNSILFFDLEKKEIIQKIGGISTYRGISINNDETFLWAGGGDGGKIYEFSIENNGKLKLNREKFLGGYISDLLLIEDKGLLYALSNTNSKIFEISIKELEIKRLMKADIFPYDMLLYKKQDILFVSNTGSSTLSSIDLKTGKNLKLIKTGKNPENMAIDENNDLLFVANSDSDSISVIDTKNLVSIKEIDLSGNPQGFKAGNVNGVSLSNKGDLLFVSHARLNKVDVVSLPDGKVIGSIPTGWYPTEIAITPDGKKLLILSSKGIGSINYIKNIAGLLSIVEFSEINKKLGEWSELVKKNNLRGMEFFKDSCSPQNILPLQGKDSPIKHIVLIVRENKTYDEVLGDFERGDGDPNLCLFGEKYTPNLHKLVREFVNLDNFYSNPEVSIQGHMWTTTADCNDYVEKLWRDQIAIFAYEPASLPEGGTIFDLLFTHGRDFRNYGEFAGFGPYLLNKYEDFIDHKYPFFNMDIKDVDKAAEFIRELNLGIFPEFIYIGLPNDHTYGTKPGAPSPDSMVSDNDLATGIIVEAISKSIYWPNTLIFIIEDDPQSFKGDHIDAHRSICAVISPWVKRGFTSSVHYDIPSIYKTIEMILSLPSMNKNDFYAPPMADIFTDMPDYTPFEAVAVDVPWKYNTQELPLSSESEKIDFSHPDGAKSLGYILWRYMKGNIEPPPYGKGIDE